MGDTPKRDLRALDKAELEKISSDLKTNIDLELAMGYFEQLMPRIATVMKPGLGIDKLIQGMVLLDKKIDGLKKDMAALKEDVEQLKDELCPIESEEPPVQTAAVAPPEPKPVK